MGFEQLHVGFQLVLQPARMRLCNTSLGVGERWAAAGSEVRRSHPAQSKPPRAPGAATLQRPRHGQRAVQDVTDLRTAEVEAQTSDTACGLRVPPPAPQRWMVNKEYAEMRRSWMSCGRQGFDRLVPLHLPHDSLNFEVGVEGSCDFASKCSYLLPSYSSFLYRVTSMI